MAYRLDDEIPFPKQMLTTISDAEIWTVLKLWMSYGTILLF